MEITYKVNRKYFLRETAMEADVKPVKEYNIYFDNEEAYKEWKKDEHTSDIAIMKLVAIFNSIPSEEWTEQNKALYERLKRHTLIQNANTIKDE